ncbi:predicted protein, partial [Nematostella vectensis]
MARLGAHAHEKSWCASTKSENQWLSVTLSKAYPINGLAVKGNEILDQWTQTIKIEYTDDLIHCPRGIEFYDYTEGGRTRIFRGYRDRETAVKSALSQPIVLRFLRFYPTRWYEYPGLRVELYG